MGEYIGEQEEQREGDLEQAISLMRETGALEDTRARALSVADEAKAALSVLPGGELNDLLAELAGFVVARIA